MLNKQKLKVTEKTCAVHHYVLTSNRQKSL